MVMILKMQEKFKSNFIAVEKTTALDLSSHLIAFYNNKSKFAIQKLPNYRALINNPVRSHIQSDYYLKKKSVSNFRKKSWRSIAVDSVPGVNQMFIPAAPIITQACFP